MYRMKCVVNVIAGLLGNSACLDENCADLDENCTGLDENYADLQFILKPSPTLQILYYVHVTCVHICTYVQE